MRSTTWIAGTALLCCLPAAMAGQAAPSAPPGPPQAAQEQAPPPPAQPAPAAADEDAAPVEAIRRYSYERRAEAVAAARRADADIDRRLDALQADMGAQWGRMADTTRTRSQDAMNRLRGRRTDLAEWYGGMRHGSAGAWKEVTTGFVDSYRAMADALRRAREEFRQQSTTPSAAPAPEPPPKDRNDDANPPDAAANGA